MNLDLDHETHMKPKVMHLHGRIISQWNVTKEGKKVQETLRTGWPIWTG